jgi:hypothetical protein
MIMNRIYTIVLAAALLPSLRAALPNSTVFELRSLGNNANGGCYITGSSGTDFTQQNAAQYTFTNLSSANGTTNPSTVASVSHSFVASDVGNCIHVTAGTNWTQGFYRIVSVAASAATVDRQVGSSAALTNGTFAVGGALATAAALATALGTCGGCTAFVKADGTYSTAASIAFAYTGSPGQQVTGYSSTRGDNLPATIQASGTVTGVKLVTTTGQGVLSNFILDCATHTACGGLSIGTNSFAQNIEIKNAGEQQVQLQLADDSMGCRFCQVHDVAGASLGAAVVNFSATDAICWACTVYNLSGANTFVFNMPAGQCLYCTIAAVTGSSSIGFKFVSSAGVGPPIVDHSVVYNLNGDAVQITNISAIGQVTNTIFDTVVNGINNNSGTTLRSGDFLNDYNYTFSASGAPVVNVTAGTNSVTLSADPFTSPSTRNFTLNGTAGGGRSVLNVGFPQSLPGVLGSGFPSGGLLQPKVTSPGSAVVP